MSPGTQTILEGYSLPRVIFGAWQLSSGHSSTTSDIESSLLALADASPGGPVVFDCADIYTGVEEQLGHLIRAVRRRSGEDYARRIKVHTKFVPNLEDLARIDRMYVRRSIERSLERLGKDSLDLVQLHWWDFSVPGCVEAAHYLSELRAEGKLLHIGVTNFDTAHLRDLVEAGIAVVSNQVQYSLFDQRPCVSLAEYAERHGITLLCYGALAGGFLTDTFLNASEPREPYTNRSLVKYKLIIDEVGGWEKAQGLLCALHQIAQSRGCSIADVAAGFVLQQSAVGAVIAGIPHGNTSRAPLNPLMVFSAYDRSLLDTCIREMRKVPGEVYELERQRDGPHGKIMRYNLNSA
jgi:aryl-alcohol dehydrogenase-like predicted oxidoreductase